MTAKTYVLAPNFTTPPGSSIRLGALLADPLAPHRALTSLDPAKWPEVTTTTQRDLRVTGGRAHSASLSAGSRVLGAVGARLGFELARDESAEYAAAAVRTDFFAADPGEDDVRALLQAPRVRSAMQSAFWSRPLYLITGIVTAEGLSVSSSATARRGGGAGADADGVAALAGGVATLDLDAAVAREDRRGLSFTADGEVVLAYRLLRILRKGWKEKRLALDEYTSKAAFLGTEEEEEGWGDELEVAEADACDFAELDDDAPAQSEDHGNCRYVVLD